ncbi:claudin-7-like [Lethenteron reissneri]|uniref:claudin-7-like n=1 Tax=Lethenteron reissneri TaxID=7753 RepID=UPI002AB65BE7|nr:claudin-7-like [Lethenteron reissneri]
MAVTGMQVLGASLAFVGLVGVIVCTASNEWRITSRAKSLMTASWVSHGLWKQCTANAMGSMQCKPNFTMLDLDVYIRACQGLMVSSVVIGGLAALCTLFGMKCTHVGPLTAKSKAHMSLFSGISYMFSGAAAVTAVSYYAHAVHHRLLRPISHRSQVRVRLWSLRRLGRLVPRATGRGPPPVRRLQATARIIGGAALPRDTPRLPVMRRRARGGAARRGGASSSCALRPGHAPRREERRHLRRAGLRSLVHEQQQRSSRTPPPQERVRVSERAYV